MFCLVAATETGRFRRLNDRQTVGIKLTVRCVVAIKMIENTKFHRRQSPTPELIGRATAWHKSAAACQIHYWLERMMKSYNAAENSALARGSGQNEVELGTFARA